MHSCILFCAHAYRIARRRESLALPRTVMVPPRTSVVPPCSPLPCLTTVVGSTTYTTRRGLTRGAQWWWWFHQRPRRRRDMAGQTPRSAPVSLTCGTIDLWAPAISHHGCMNRVYLAVAPVGNLIFFFICFSRFCSKLQKFISWARSVQIRWSKFCWIHHEVYYLIKIGNLLFAIFFLGELNWAR